MPKKGETNNPKGRTPGTKNKKTLEWEALGDAITGKGAERFMEILDSMDEADFTKNYLMILEYFKPKQQRSEVKTDGEVTINWVENRPKR